MSDKIDGTRFAKMSKRYEQEQGENARRIKALRLELKKAEGRQMDVDQFLETVRRYTNVTAITQRMVTELIDHIDVYHAEQDAMGRHKRIVIHYNCIGASEVPDPIGGDHHENAKGRSRQLHPHTNRGIKFEHKNAECP